MIVSGLFKFVQKNCRYSIWVNLIPKNKILLNIYLIYIKNVTLIKKLSSMCQSIFTIHISDSMFPLTVYIFKVFLGCAYLRNNPVVNLGMYVRMIQWQQRMFIYIGLCLIQHSNIFSIFTFNIFNVFFPAGGFHLVILLGILNIQISLFHYYLNLKLVKGAECYRFCEKMSTLFYLNLV